MSEPSKIIDHENQTPLYTNAFVLYQDGNNLILNFGFIDQLSNIFKEDIDIEDDNLSEAKSIGRFVMSYDLAIVLLEKLAIFIQETTEEYDIEDEDKEDE